MPTQDEVKNIVLGKIADIANIAKSQIALTDKLTGQPIAMDGNDLADLALELRKYVQQHKPGNTVSVAEVSTTNLTVAQLITLIHGKV